MSLKIFDIFILYFVFNCLAFSIYLIGNLINSKIKLLNPKNNFEDVYVSYLIGLIFLYSVIAVLFTKGISSFSIVFILTLLFIWIKKKINLADFSEEKSDLRSSKAIRNFKYISIVSLIIFILNICLNYLIYFVYNRKCVFCENQLLVPNDVLYYYYTLSHNIIELNKESYYINPINLYPSHYISYHFAELWLAGFFEKIISYHTSICMNLLVFPLFILGFVWGTICLLFNGGKFKKVELFILSILVTFFSGFYYLRGVSWLTECLIPFAHLGNVWFAPKITVVYLFLPVLILLYSRYRFSIEFLINLMYWLMIISISYFALSPVWFSMILLIWVFMVIMSIKNKVFLALNYSTAFMLFYYMLCLFFMFWIFPKFSGGYSINHKNSIPLDFYSIFTTNLKLKLKIIYWGIIKTLLLFLPCFIFIAVAFVKRIILVNIFFLLFAVIFFIVPILIWALFVPLYDAEQLYVISEVPILGFVLIYIILYKANKNFIYIFFTIILINFVYQYMMRLKVDKERIPQIISTRNPELETFRKKVMPYFTEINNNLVAVFFSNDEDRILADGSQIVPAFFPLLLDKNHHFYIVSISEKLFEKKLMNEMKLRYFTLPFPIYISKFKDKNIHSNDLIIQQFLKEYKIKLLISDTGDLPKYLMSHVQLIEKYKNFYFYSIDLPKSK